MSGSQPSPSDYAEEHARLNGAGDDRPTAIQVLRDQGLLTLPNRLSGKTILISGGTSGLGFEEAKALYLTGARVFIVGRGKQTEGRDVAACIGKSFEAEDRKKTMDKENALHPVEFLHMDLSDLDSVRDGAIQFLKRSDNKLNLLICNAGIMSPPKKMTTKQDHEMQFGVNYLAHFLLFKLLCPSLLECSADDFASRVIMVASCAHRGGGLVADGDYDFQKTEYDPGTSYGQSKTATIYMANELERQMGAKGLHGWSAHPGIIMETDLVRHMTDDNKKMEKQLSDEMPMFARQVKTSQQGAGSILWAAVATKLEGTGGLYLEDCHVSQPVREGVEWFEPGRESWCYDESAEKKLWVDTEEILKSWL